MIWTLRTRFPFSILFFRGGGMKPCVFGLHEFWNRVNVILEHSLNPLKKTDIWCYYLFYICNKQVWVGGKWSVIYNAEYHTSWMEVSRDGSTSLYICHTEFPTLHLMFNLFSFISASQYLLYNLASSTMMVHQTTDHWATSNKILPPLHYGHFCLSPYIFSPYFVFNF